MKTEDRTERTVIFKSSMSPDAEELEVSVSITNGQVTDICVREDSRLTLMVSESSGGGTIDRAELIANLLLEAVAEGRQA